MTRHCEFMMESRPYGGQLTNFVGIRCGWCKQEEWHPARNGGWAMRIFRAHGWKVANKDAQHRCPTCFGKAKNARRIPDNPVIPKELGRLIKTTLMEAHVKDALLGSTVITRDPEKPVRAPLMSKDPIPPREPPMAATPAPAPGRAFIPAKRGKQDAAAKSGSAMFSRRVNAVRSGTTFTGSTDGAGFYVFPVPDHEGLWFWKLAKDTTPDERAAWLPHHLTPRRNASRPTRIAKEEPKMTTNVTPITRKDPMPSASTPEEVAKMASSIVSHVAAVPPAQPSRDQRQLIHDELTKVYDPVDQRYGGTDSDKVLAARLDVPRVWVSDIRAMFFGDHDRNQQSEKQKLKLDAAIDMAKAATQHLLNMAAEAEALEKSLAEARKLLAD